MNKNLLLCASLIASPGFSAGFAFADPPKVVTDLPPIHALVAMVMGDLATPDLLLSQGADAHDFQLRPSQAADLAHADLLIWVGAGMTPWLERARSNMPASAQILTLMEISETVLRPFSAEADEGHDRPEDHANQDGTDHAQSAGHTPSAGHDTDHGDAHNEDHNKDHGDDDGHADDHGPKDDHGHADAHDHGPTDPHIWLDPLNAQRWLPRIAAELARIDPENAARYGANAQAAQAELAALELDIAAQLSPVKDRPFMTYHDAYGYFTAHFGLNFAGSLRQGDANAPGAARLTKLQDALRAGKADCLFPEANHLDATTAQIIEGSPARLGAALDPEGTTLPAGQTLYAGLMRGMTKAIVECLSDQ